MLNSIKKRRKRRKRSKRQNNRNNNTINTRATRQKKMTKAAQWGSDWVVVVVPAASHQLNSLKLVQKWTRSLFGLILQLLNVFLAFNQDNQRTQTSLYRILPQSCADPKLPRNQFHWLSVISFQLFSFLKNCRKILKKHDKLMESTSGAEWRERHVETAPFHNNKQILQFITQTEVINLHTLSHLGRPYFGGKGSISLFFWVNLFFELDEKGFKLPKRIFWRFWISKTDTLLWPVIHVPLFETHRNNKNAPESEKLHIFQCAVWALQTLSIAFILRL